MKFAQIYILHGSIYRMGRKIKKVEFEFYVVNSELLIATNSATRLCDLKITLTYTPSTCQKANF